MSYEVLIKRTIYVAKCPTCGESEVRTENPPRERFCQTDKIWVPFVEDSYIGPSLEKK